MSTTNPQQAPQHRARLVGDLARHPMRPKSAAEMLKHPQYLDRIAAALPQHLTPERFASIALLELRRTPKLADVDPISLFGCMLQIGQLGLEIGERGAHLIPFKRTRPPSTVCEIIVGYRGLVQLATNSPKVAKVECQCVREGDDFDYELGSNEFIRHRPSLAKRGEVVGAYAIATLVDGSRQIEVMGREEIEQVRDRSQGAGRDDSPWKTDFDPVARKTVLRRLCKYIPSSPELGTALQIDGAQAHPGSAGYGDWLEGEVLTNPTEPEPQVEQEAAPEAVEAAPAKPKKREAAKPRANDKRPAKEQGELTGGASLSYAEIAGMQRQAKTEAVAKEVLDLAKANLPEEQTEELVANHVARWGSGQPAGGDAA